MASNGLYCNYKKCHVLLSNTAWVTSCGHIFCNDHAERELNPLPASCSVCKKTLMSKVDVARVDLNPSDLYKEMILLGHSPEVILDVATRAIRFWGRQVAEERVRGEDTVKQHKDSTRAVEQYYESVILSFKEEIAAGQRRCADLNQELCNAREMIQGLSREVHEKGRQCMKLQTLYDAVLLKVDKDYVPMALDLQVSEMNNHPKSPFLQPGNPPRRGSTSPSLTEVSRFFFRPGAVSQPAQDREPSPGVNYFQLPWSESILRHKF